MTAHVLRREARWVQKLRVFAGRHGAVPARTLMLICLNMIDDASKALDQLLTQHDALRAMMDRCEVLADEVDFDDGSTVQLIREVAQLRLAFDTHNRFEEAVLRPILGAVDAFSEIRIDRMVTDHVGEHHALRERLGTGPTAELRATIATLREHLATEERHFLSARGGAEIAGLAQRLPSHR